ncbi:MAG: hypothetical protein D6690_07775 [Nitrospirae bacterium]|nr:MAG: hypothetical protein D6690_07775 [Nitrospirota bacterium]
MLLIPGTVPSHQIGGKPASERSDLMKVEIVMTDHRYQTKDGEPAHELVFEAGKDVMIVLRNDDLVPHEFITPLFTRTEVHFSGEATGIFGRDAAGFRLGPGKTLNLWFKVPFSRPFDAMYDVAWCNLHMAHAPIGKQGHELLIMATHDVSSS